MAIVTVNQRDRDLFIGKAADTKPTVASPGSAFYEEDDGKLFIFTNDYENTLTNDGWKEVTALSGAFALLALHAHQMITKPYLDLAADASVKEAFGGSGDLFFFEVSNVDAADYYLQIFDSRIADVDVGTTLPTLAFLIPAGDATLHGGADRVFAVPLRFENGLCYAVTTTSVGNTGPSTPAVLNLGI